MAAICLWCKREAVERGTLAPGKGPLWAAVFPPLMLPVYFLRTRRFPGAIMAMAKALGFYVCLLAIFLAGVVGAAFAFSFVGQVRRSDFTRENSAGVPIGQFRFWRFALPLYRQKAKTP